MKVHLCQPDQKKSCAACCGLYNYVDNTREGLKERLAYRTRLFKRVRSGQTTLDEYRQVIRHREDSRRIYKTIYTCEFAGYMDESEQKVGCMLHPMQNSGNDLRDISFYGKDLCEGHFCPSYQKLDEVEMRTLIDVINDWYLYGVVVTDIDFVKAFFQILQDRLGTRISPDKVAHIPVLSNCLLRYFSLKQTWPYRDLSRPRFGKYYFVGEEYNIDKIDYESINAERSIYDAIFLSLASRFQTKEDLARAESIIDGIIDEFCKGYTNYHSDH
jgi:hypothetical protein